MAIDRSNHQDPGIAELQMLTDGEIENLIDQGFASRQDALDNADSIADSDRAGIADAIEASLKREESMLRVLRARRRVLPESAELQEGLGGDASPWLDGYIAFSRKWSPRAFNGFHESCALWLLSTIAARRVVLHMGKPWFTNLYVANIARTSLFAKSVTSEIAVHTLSSAGLDWLLLPDYSTPQRFIFDLSTLVPENYDEYSSSEQERIRLRLALSGQRGWFYEEFGQHLEAMMRPCGYMSDFRGLLRRFDDCRPRYETATIGRGQTVVERPYLALLANMTPADMKPLAQRGAAMWADGFWARFAFVFPDRQERKRGKFPDGERIIPDYLIAPLRKWHQRLGMPSVEIKDILNEEGKPTGRKVANVSPLEPRPSIIDDEARDAFYRYHDALLDMVEGSDHTELDGNYSRFAEKALRIAILLASLENNDNIELRHWARGQEIAERWRSNLHALFAAVNEREPSEQVETERKILNVVGYLKWATPREVSPRIRGLSVSEAGKIPESLRMAGALVMEKQGKTFRYGFPNREV